MAKDYTVPTTLSFCVFLKVSNVIVCISFNKSLHLFPASTTTSRAVKREIWAVLEATRSSQFFTDGKKFSSTVSLPLHKNKLRTNFWTEKSMPLLRLLQLPPDAILIKSKSLVFICFSPCLYLSLQKGSSHFLLRIYIYFFGTCLWWWTDNISIFNLLWLLFL